MDLSNENLLEEGPGADFQGATLQIHQDSYLCSRSPSSLENEVSVAKLSVSPDASRLLPVEREAGKRDGSLDENGLKPGVSSGVGVVAPIISIPKRISEKFKRTRSKSDTPLQSNAICQKPILEEDEAKYFFAYRDSLVQNAIKECISDLVKPDEDGEILGSWLLTEISFWDHEKERLILLTTKVLITVKYDFIALKQLEFRKVSLDLVDTLIIGDLIYPSGSIVPAEDGDYVSLKYWHLPTSLHSIRKTSRRLNGLTSGVMTVVKGCLLRPLQERWTQSNTEKDFCSSAFDYISFEPRSRNIRGLRAMWNNGEPLTFIKKWNPFNNDIPWTTYTSHPLLWRKDSTNSASEIYDIDDFAQNIVSAVEKAQTTNIRSSHCNIEHKPIVLENYVGIGSLIHNRNSLGFFKVRGKFSF